MSKKFNLRSGNTPEFKEMGSSPFKILGAAFGAMGLMGRGPLGGPMGSIMDRIRARRKAPNLPSKTPDGRPMPPGMDPGMRAEKARGGRRGGASRLLGGLFSDSRLKENINKIGESKSGIPIYEFNYIGDNNKYSGAMAQDLLEIKPEVVILDEESGYYKVDYNNIDVNMHLLN